MSLNYSIKKNQCGALKHNLMIIVLLIGIAVPLMWIAIPASFSTDLSLIGKGKPAVAIIYDLDDLRSQNLMDAFNQIREIYDEKVEFLVVDLGVPEGRRFAQTKASLSAGAHFFSAEGKKVLVLEGTHDIEVLKRNLNNVFRL